MAYNVSILRRAQKELAEIPVPIYEQICQKICNLSSNPRPTHSKKLVARPAWRIRVGSYRVIYEINDKDKTILILDIGHRRDVYS